MTTNPSAPTPPLDDDALLARALEAFRDDCARAPAADLAARVFAGVRRGDDESARFLRLARAYSAAAAVLLVVGVTGSVLTRPSGHVARSAPRIADVEANRLARELAVTIDDQRVGGR
jgi:hypothetical protein